MLLDAYCRTVGIEYMHMQEPDQKAWIQQHVERQPEALLPDEKRRILQKLNEAEAFERHDVITMKADWTNRDDVISDYLARFGRSSIPFYVLYRPGAEPHVFGELLTKGRVLDALSDSIPSRAPAR